MDATERTAKLREIAGLPEGQLRGWWWWVVQKAKRQEFDGERAALLARARELNIKNLQKEVA